MLTKLLVTPTPRAALVAGTNVWLDAGVLISAPVAGIGTAAALLGQLAR